MHSIAHKGSKNHHPGCFWKRFDLITDINLSRLLDWLSAPDAVDRRGLRKQHAQKIMDLGQRSNGATWTSAGVLLFRANGRRQVSDLIDIRAGDLIKVLSRVNRLAFQELSLAFGKDRINRQRTFSRPTATTNHDESVLRNIDIDIFQAVRSSTPRTSMNRVGFCLLYTSPSPRDQRGSRMPSSA